MLVSESSISKEWQSEEERSDSPTEGDNDDHAGNGDDEVWRVGVGRCHLGKQNPQGRGHSTEPSVWELRKRGPGGCAIQKPSSTSLRPQQTTRLQKRKRLKMSEETLSVEPFDYCNDVPHDPFNQGGNTPLLRGMATLVPRLPPIHALDLEIAEKQLQLLQWRRAPPHTLHQS